LDEADHEGWFVATWTVVDAAAPHADHAETEVDRVACTSPWTTVMVAGAPPLMRVTVPRRAAPAYGVTERAKRSPDIPFREEIVNHDWFDVAFQ